MHRLIPEGDREAFEAAIGSAPAMLWLSLANGECVFLSPSWYDYTGLDALSGLGEGWQGPIHPEDRQRVLEAFQGARAVGAKYQVEYRLRAADGTYRWVLDSAAPFSNRRSGVATDGYAGSIVEIEQRKQAELQRDLAAFRAKLSVEASEIGLWEWDLGTNLFDFSSQARKIFGLEGSTDPVTFRQMERAIHPDDAAEVRRKSAAALDPDVRASETYQYRILHPDGSVRWVHARGEAIFEEQPAPQAVRYIGTFRDVTASVRQEQSLRQAAERLRLAINAAGLAIWELDVASGQVAPSPELNRLFGFPDDATPTLAEFHDRYAPGESERVAQLGAEAEARGDDEIRLEVKHILPNGEERWLLVLARKAIGNDGRDKVVGVAMNITETKSNEYRLAIVAKELQHRVKNTLSIVQTLAKQTFRQDRDIGEAKRAFEHRIQSLARTTDLLTQDSGAGAKLRSIVDDALSSFRGGDRSLIRVSGDDVVLPAKLAVAMGMALHELATNAMKYGALSGDGYVELSWRREGDVLRLTWQEVDGPLVSTPTTRGFGTRLLSGALFTAAEGDVSLEYPAKGLVCKMSIKLG
jgi:PAS domain S-box-containing protein